MSATPSAGALRAAEILIRDNYANPSLISYAPGNLRQRLAHIIHKETQADTAALVAEIKEAWTIVNILHMEQMDQKEVWPRALIWLEKNEALAKRGEGAE